MNKKKLNQLQLNDKFWFVRTDYKAQDRPYIETIEVKNIGITNKHCKSCDDEGKPHLYINEHNGYHTTFSILILEENAKTETIETNDGYYTTSIEKVNQLVRSAGLSFIEKLDKEIQDKEQEKTKVREAYWEYLNSDDIK